MIEYEEVLRYKLNAYLTEQHSVRIAYDLGDYHVLRVNTYTLKGMMEAIVQGDKVLNVPCFQKGKGEKWDKRFVTVFLPNVRWIEWPDVMADEAHGYLNGTIEDFVNEMLEGVLENSDEGLA